MFNLDTNALTAQVAAKSTAEKKAIRNYVNKYYAVLNDGNFDFDDVSCLYDEMVADPDISVQTFVAFFLYANM